MVRVTGLEPARLATQEPKSCVSANSTTPAHEINITIILSCTLKIKDLCGISEAMRIMCRPGNSNFEFESESKYQKNRN